MPALTVSAAVADRSLVSLATVKAELGITDTDSDTLLTQWIADDSDAVCEACGIAADQVGRRTVLAEAVTIAYRPTEVSCGHAAPLILPWRLPLEVSAVTVAGVPLSVATDVECEPMAALLWRLDAAGNRTPWTRAPILITGTAGWALADVPAALRGAVVEMCRARWAGRDRNPLLKAEEVDGVGRQEFWVGSQPGNVGQLPESALCALRSAGLVNVVLR